MKTNTPIKSIRQHCLECSCQQKGEVLNCQIKDCPLYPFRLGTNPNRKGILKGFGQGKVDNVQMLS